MNAGDLIASAGRLLNVTASGEVMSGPEINDALSVLQAMVDAWQAERLLIFQIQRQVFVPATLKQVYTMGTGGDFNVVRPPKIDRASVINLGNPAQPLELPLEYITDAQYQAIPVKNIQAALPLRVWDDQAFPLRNLTFWPVPNVQVNFAFYTWTAISTFSDLTTDITFPPAYLAAMRYNLAVRLGPEFARAVPDDVRALATESKARIKSMNILPIDLQCDAALVGKSGQYNWLTDRGVGRRY